jgi:ABC-type multidrug transport system permease subunit
MRHLINRLWRLILRPASFVGKDITQIRRQPQLIVALIIAPFLVLLLFGIGFEGSAPPIKTALVIPADSDLSTNRSDYEDKFVSPLVLDEVTTEIGPPLRRLRDQDIDLVVAFPDDAFDTISAGTQAEITVYYNELVPFERHWLEFYTKVQTYEINQLVQREVLEQGLAQSQSGLDGLNQYPEELNAGLDRFNAALAAGDTEQAQTELANMRKLTEDTRDAASQSRLILLAAARSVGAGGAPQSPPIQALESIDNSLVEIETGITNTSTKISTPNTGPEDVEPDLEFIAQRRNDFASTAAELPAIPVEVLLSPFEARENNLAPTSPDFVEFYAPAVLALLIQHIAITLTALALVRERTGGTFELFRVAPISAREVLTGKYLSYFIIGIALSAILALVIIYGLGVPLLGNWLQLALIIGLVLAASLGVGFLISAVARTETQAVQAAMILLLAAVFFSGFFLPLDNLLAPVQLIAYLLPVTYGISGFQEVMLRGSTPPDWMIAGPAIIAIATTIATGLVLRLQFRTQ